MTILFVITASLIFILIGSFAIVSLIEHEFRAFRKSILLAVFVLLFAAVLVFISFSGYAWIAYSLIGIVAVAFLILILPINGNFKLEHENPEFRCDERDTMFSRLEITRNPDLQEKYYKNNVQKLASDKLWQTKPGLMSEKATMYSSLTFTAADAGFFPIEQLRPFVNGKVADSKKVFTPEKITNFLHNWTKKMGAVSVGFCEMKDYHFYFVRGRGKAYGKDVKVNHKFGIALTVEMDKDMLATGPAGPTLMESAQQYLNSGVIAIQLAKFIREMGYEARAHIDGNYELICPLVARDAGLGEIGRMGLLITPELGPRVRIAVVTTNIPLLITERQADYSVHDFCGICKKCADVCPSQAIAHTPIANADGVQRWKINHEKCFAFWCTSGTDCGRCMSVCPYSHPNNVLHNLVRWGIKHSWLFRRFALMMDDFFYGRKPKPAKVPEWMQ